MGARQTSELKSCLRVLLDKSYAENSLVFRVSQARDCQRKEPITP